MPSYLEIALRAASLAHAVHSESRPDVHVSTGRVASQSRSSRTDVATKPRVRPNELAPSGSSDCAGCCDVVDGKKIHPPKCSEGYRNWLLRWDGKGRIQ